MLFSVLPFLSSFASQHWNVSKSSDYLLSLHLCIYHQSSAVCFLSVFMPGPFNSQLLGGVIHFVLIKKKNFFFPLHFLFPTLKVKLFLVKYNRDYLTCFPHFICVSPTYLLYDNTLYIILVSIFR